VGTVRPLGTEITTLTECPDSETKQVFRTRYTSQRAEDAFAEIVRRHVDLVHSAALRQVRSPELAEEVAQAVFIELARQARHLPPRTMLAAWLHHVTRRRAIDVVRREAGRRLREQTAQELEAMNATAQDWTHIEPLLDDAMDALEETDRVAVLLRYFQNKPLREVGQAIGVSDDAAQKRVSRAVERLREFFAKRGVTVGASGLVVVISANAVQAAPVGLVVTISTAAALVPTTVLTTTTATFGKVIAMTTTQKVLVTVALAAAVGTGIYEARQASQLRDQVQTLQQQQAPLTEQLTQLKAANERLSSQVVQARDSQALSKAQLEELMRLRGKAGLAQADSRELAQLKSTLADQTAKTQDQLTNSMAAGMEMAVKARMKMEQPKLDRMKKSLNLTEEQARSINDIVLKHTQRQLEMVQESVTGKTTPEQRQARAAEGDKDDEIKALFTPEQLAAYPEYQQAEKTAEADKSASGEASQIASDFRLSHEQQEQIRAAFYQMNMNEQARGLNHEELTAAKKSGNLAEANRLTVELNKSQLEEKLKILGRVLTPAQINSYREEKMNEIKMAEKMTKMFLPKKAAGTAN